MDENYIKIRSKHSNESFLRVFPGHFVTNHSHVNYYVDMTALKARMSEAQNAAKTIASYYTMNSIVDTIICMDGTEVIGSFLAEELEHSGIRNVNAHNTIYVVSPETDSSGRIVFRDNNKFMVENRNVMVLLATATTGITLERSLTCIKYYGGKIAGISALYSVPNKIFGYPIVSLFSQADLPQYKTFPFDKCPLCQQGIKIDAMVNGYGYSKI